MRQLLAESPILTVIGRAMGLLFAFGVKGVVNSLPAVLPRVEEVPLDGRVLWFTMAISVIAAILFELAPALRSARAGVQETLKARSPKDGADDFHGRRSPALEGFQTDRQ